LFQPKIISQSQESIEGNQKPETGSQKAGDRKAEVKSLGPETGSQKTGGRKAEIKSLGPESRNQKEEVRRN
jgi:hypothetical protein